ncbi:MAG: amino acid permease [Armatimonadota bacterium]
MLHLFARKTLAQIKEEMAGENRLRRVLGPVALTSLGIGCIIGAGIFVVTGLVAKTITGPALILSFVVAGIACIFAALCYAEFASMTPIAGSAYTYAYTTLGELFAWIIGWDLVLEYTVASASVANGWSKYFLNLLGMFSIGLPTYLTEAPIGVNETTGAIVPTGHVLDIMAVIIVAILTTILVLGIRESTRFNTTMVFIKVAVVIFVIAVGAFFVNPANWQPFAPFGFAGISLFGHLNWGTIIGGAPVGMLAGAAIIFFAYIGFDSVSTHAEEAKNPQRDVPIGIIASLIICTVLYIAVAAVLTGMVPYDQLSPNAAVAEAFRMVGLPWAQFLIGVGAVAGITSVLMVLMLSQPRVLLAMARDGLLPQKFFGAVHERFRTPWKSTILTGIVVAIMASLLPLRILAELVNIGTLLAFVIVCVAVLIMRVTHPEAERPFRVPLVPLIPILGILFCLLLMFSLPWQNWLRLGAWLAVGLVIYFAYGQFNSVLARRRRGEEPKPACCQDELPPPPCEI